ncbi:Uncharacterised protein [Vibrio cholerae]|nr:Uncharacterised protein [Vibrio cholerae]
MSTHIQCQFDKIHGARLIDGQVTRHIRCHIRHHYINHIWLDSIEQCIEHRFLTEITLQERHPRNRLHR